MIEKAGFYEISMADYLADPCPEPALSSAIVGALVRKTPLRAKLAHPRLTPELADFSPRADKGSAVHSLAHGGYPLEYVEQVTKRSGPEKGSIFEPTDWATKDSQDQRDAIRARGGIPLLVKDREGITAAAMSVKRALRELGAGRHEQTMVFRHEGAWCRGRADWLSDGQVTIEGIENEYVDVDTKTVDIADGVSWAKSTLFSGDLVAQIGIRHLGHIALGRPRKMVWLLAEYEAPYDTCFLAASDELIAFAVRQVTHAAKLWRQCLDQDRFPGNKRTVQYANVPAWALWDLESRGVL